MNENDTSWEAELHETAASFPYPNTPDIAGQVRERLKSASTPRPRSVRLAWALAAVPIALGLLMAVPQVRAAVFEMLRAGAITIFVGEPTAVAGRPVSEGVPSLPTTGTSSAPRLDTVIADLAGRSTLSEAQSMVTFPLRLPPAYGEPDEVYVQHMPDTSLAGKTVIMAWRDPDRPGRSRLHLYQIGSTYYGFKQAAIDAVTQTEVNGEIAFWIEGEHEIRLRDDQGQESFFVERSVLIWLQDDITYRLESDLTLEAAVAIAESLVRVDLDATAPSDADAGALAADACPVTQAPATPFIPPEAWPSMPPYGTETGQFWYGDSGLWTSLPGDGSWRQLALGEKFWWWSAEFDVHEDDTPDLTVTARRLDGDARPFQVSEATNGYHADFHWAMLIGVELASPGCWEFTGQYRGHHLTFVLWVPPE